MDNQIPPAPPVPPSPPPVKRRDWFKILLIVIGFLVILGLFGNLYFLARNQKPVTEITPTPSPLAAVPTLDVTANWKTHTVDNILSFKYPPSFIIKNPISGVVNISDSEKNFTPANLFITVDTRLIGSYANYYEAVRVGTEKLPKDSKIQDLPNGIKITWNLGAVLEQNKNHYATLEYLKYKEGAVTIQYNDDLNGPRIYDQILSTFKFLQ